MVKLVQSFITLFKHKEEKKMPLNSSEVLNKLSSEKQMLIRKVDSRDSTPAEKEAGKKRLAELEIEIRTESSRITDIKMKEMQLREQENKKQEEKRMADEIAEKAAKKAERAAKKAAALAAGEGKAKEPRENSLASIAATVLMMKTVKNMETAVDKMIEKSPGLDRKKAESRIRALIYCVKKGKPARWVPYTWNEEEFQLSLKA